MPAKQTSSMQAIGVHAYGGPEMLRAVELPEPHAGPGEVRMRVRAAGVNPADIMLRDGLPHRVVPRSRTSLHPRHGRGGDARRGP